MKTLRWIPAFLLTIAASTAHATFPVVPLDCTQFDYMSDDFLGQSIGFGSELSYTYEGEGGFDTMTTGLNGFTASPTDLAGVASTTDFSMGAEAPLSGAVLTDLFPTDPPIQANDAWATNTAYAMGDFNNGLSMFSVLQRKVIDIEQTDPEGGFVDLAGVTKGYSVFNIDGPGSTAEAVLSIKFLSEIARSGNGSGSEGYKVQLLDVTDPGNIEVISEFSGFYLDDANFGLLSEFSMGEESLDDNFSFTPLGTGPEDGNRAEFLYDVGLQLPIGSIYGLNVTSDVSGFVDRAIGGVSVHTDFTFDVGITMVNPEDRIFIEGLSTIPEPASVALLALGTLGAAISRRLGSARRNG